MAAALCIMFNVFYGAVLLLYFSFSLFAPHLLNSRGLYPERMCVSNARLMLPNFFLTMADDYTLGP
jgi:hypothetical protein